MTTGPLIQAPPHATPSGARAPEVPSAAPHVTVDGVAFDALTETEVIARVLQDLSSGRGGLLLTPNIDILRQLRRPRDADLTSQARLVVADGTPIVWASRLLGTPLPERVTGASLIWTLSTAAAEAGHRVMLVGGAEGVAERAAERLRAHHPALHHVGWHFPPFGFDSADGGLDAVVEAIATEGADIVFLGLGFPRQERVALRLGSEFPQTWFVGCGGSITLLAGDLSRAPVWMQASGLEWVHRLVQEPRRLVRRYLVDDVPFAVAMLARAGRRRMVGRPAPATNVVIPLPRSEADVTTLPASP